MSISTAPTFFDPKTLEDYNYIFVSDWAFDFAVPYIQFTAFRRWIVHEESCSSPLF